MVKSMKTFFEGCWQWLRHSIYLGGVAAVLLEFGPASLDRPVVINFKNLNPQMTVIIGSSIGIGLIGGLGLVQATLARVYMKYDRGYAKDLSWVWTSMQLGAGAFLMWVGYIAVTIMETLG
jgi:hypothetical protein